MIQNMFIDIIDCIYDCHILPGVILFFGVSTLHIVQVITAYFFFAVCKKFILKVYQYTNMLVGKYVGLQTFQWTIIWLSVSKFINWVSQKVVVSAYARDLWRTTLFEKSPVWFLIWKMCNLGFLRHSGAGTGAIVKKWFNVDLIMGQRLILFCSFSKPRNDNTVFTTFRHSSVS